MTMNRRALVLAIPLGLVAAGGCEAQAGGGMTARELRDAIDSLLPEISRVSGMEVRRPVGFALQSRSDARSFIEAQLEEELGSGELDGMERAYKAFGLLPDTLDLRSMLLDLYEEQVVGYYDPATDTLYVLDEATPETAGPVVAHELVHALQDQHTNLDSLVARDRGNDRQTAAQAAAEGQAMLVMMAVQAAQATGQRLDVAALPDLSELMARAAEANYSEFPVFQRAPRLVRETMLFPYVGGARFVQALFRARRGEAPPVPFGDLLPQSTEQVMSPEAHFLDQRDAPTTIELGDATDGWQVVYSNDLGQLETSILMVEHLGEGAAGAARGWDGDTYALLQRPGAEDAVVWYSVWDDAGAADRFAADARATGIASVVERLDVEGRALVRMVISSDDEPIRGVPGVRRLTGDGGS